MQLTQHGMEIRFMNACTDGQLLPQGISYFEPVDGIGLANCTLTLRFTCTTSIKVVVVGLGLGVNQAYAPFPCKPSL